MFHLRRTALRAVLSAAKPAPSVVVPKTRTFVSLNQSKLRPARQWTASSLQKRFASDQATQTEKAQEEKIEEVSTEPAEVIAEAEPMGNSSQASISEVAVDAIGAAEGAAAATPAPRQTSSYGAGAGLPSPNKVLYVGNIFFDVNRQGLEDYFARFGTVNSSKIVYDNRGLSKGFGYVEFENMDDAVRAVEEANQQVFQGRRLAVQFHRPRQSINRHSSKNPPSKTLFIGNMSFEMSDKDLSDLFREVRNVIDVRIAIDRRTGTPRGFAHADFVDVASAQKALEMLQHKEVYGRVLRVDYSLPSPRTPQTIA